MMHRFVYLILPLPLLAACGDSEPSGTTTGSSMSTSTAATTGTGGEGGAQSTGGAGGGAAGSGGVGGAGGAGGQGGGSADVGYKNPVVRGDFADPSVLRVGNEYWATATSSEWGPVYPLLHSTDLVNWTQVGSIFSDRPAWAVSNFWAPEIQEDNGTYFIYYTARKAGESLCVAVATADAPGGPYTDHGPLVCQQVGSIDGFSIRDENGKRYLVWKEDANSVGMVTPIWAQELTDDGKTLLGQPVFLFQNDPSWEANLVEGPYILVHNNTFYAFYSAAACCGKSCSYALGVARSKTLLGPWEKNPNNPILVGNEAWKCPGHGSIVTADGGKYYLLYHAYSGQDTVYVGRQGMLDEVVFGADGWPTINDGKGPSVSAPAPIAPQAPQPTEIFDDFSAADLAPGWQWPVANKPMASIDTTNGGRLVLPAAPEGPGVHAGATIARSTLLGDYVATTEVSAPANVRAGLAAVGDGDNALGVSVLGDKVMVWRLGNGTSQPIAEAAAPIKAQLRMTAAKGHVYSFAVSGDDGKTWEPVGSYVDSQAVDPDLPPWDRGVRVGLLASGPAGTSAKFEFLRVTLGAPQP